MTTETMEELDAIGITEAWQKSAVLDLITSALQKQREEFIENVEGSVYALIGGDQCPNELIKDFDSWRKNVLPGLINKQT